ncbi:MAG: alkaline phosphatase family protein [Desulfurococcales archaeon]|nr:alkaline phosphatase family protein [Desulfurococcales archaeon]
MTRSSVAVLGLDALPYWVLPLLRDRGLAPSIAGDKELSRARRLTAIPPITPASWPSIMSGVNPGKHGLFSFFHYDRKNYRQRLVTALDLEHPRIHEMLSYEGVESFVLNPIPDYPPLPARKASIISNLFFVPEPYSKPAGLVEKYFGGLAWPPGRNPEYYEEYMERVVGLAEDLAREPPPLAWLNVNFPDAIYHKLPDTVEKPWKVSHLWSLADRIVRVLKGGFDNVLIVSDHGFRIFKYRVNINDILEKHGYVVRASDETEEVVEEQLMKAKKVETARIYVPTRLYKLIALLGLEPLARKVFYNIVRPLYKRLTGRTLVARSGASIDYARSKACMPFGGAYGVYLKDVSHKSEVMRILSSYRGLLVWDSSEVYRGPYTRRGPNIVVVGKHDEGYVLGPARLMGEEYTKTRYPGHDMWGVMIPVQGFESLGPGNETLPTRVVAPLVQCTMGLPVSHAIDDLDLVTKLCGRKPDAKNYIGKFRVSKNLALRRGRGL